LILLALLLQERSKLEQYLVEANDPAVLAAALGVAFFLGAAHALTPGHGKALVAAYLVGSGGTIADAVYLGAVITITHTASVFALGLVTLYASTMVSLDRIYPWIELASGSLVFLIGLWLLWRRSRPRKPLPDSDPAGPPAGHPHGPAHAFHHGHTHGMGFAHHHHHSGGLERGGLLSLGVSGGLVPCPEALVVLMLSISMRRVLLGLGLLTSFSLGLAAVLIVIGVAMVMAGPAVRRAAGDSPWTARLPLISAAVVTLIGLGMLVKALPAL